MNFNIKDMRILAIGINRSEGKKNKKEDKCKYENWRNPNSPADKKINGALEKYLKLVYKKNFFFTDFIDVKKTNKKFKKIKDEDKLILCYKNKSNLLSLKEKFNINLIICLFKSDTCVCKGFSGFFKEFKKEVNIPIVRINHPSRVSGSYSPKHIISDKEYAKEIQEAIEKELKKK